MIKVFLDTNILIDLIADRRPYSKYAVLLFKKAEEKKVKLYTSSHSIATSHYLLKKYMDEKDLRSTLLSLLDYINIISIETDTIKKGLKSSHKDFEDALQIIAAQSVEKMEYIVTRNLKDFKTAEIEVLPPEEMSSRIK